MQCIPDKEVCKAVARAGEDITAAGKAVAFDGTNQHYNDVFQLPLGLGE
jgi:hypothetical protein